MSTTPGPDAERAYVLLHGLGGSAFDWEPVAALLDGTCLVPNLLGHGGRMWDDEVSFDALAADLAAQCDEAGRQHVFIAGTSMGAGVATTFASLWPERVDALLLVAPSWLDEREPQNLRRLQKIGRIIATHGSAYASGLLRGVAPVAGWDAVDIGQWEQRFLSADASAVSRALVELPRVLPVIDTRALAGIEVLVLTWENDPIHPVDLATRLGARLPAPLRVEPRPTLRAAEATLLAEAIAGLAARAASSVDRRIGSGNR